MSEVSKRPPARRIVGAAIVALALAAAGSAAAKKKDELPQTTPEGLQLVTQTKSRIVYLADDVDFTQYTKVLLVDCAVAFKKNWQRDYNRQERDISRHVKDKDVERIKDTLAKEFADEFTKVLEKSGHDIVTEPAADVLILRPAIINLDVSAPAIQSAGRSRTYTADPGQMTLYLELYDSVSGALLAKAMDAKDAGRGAPVMTYTSKASNIAAADRILREWAEEMAGHLGEATNTGADE